MQTSSFHKISNLIEKITHLEIAKREYFYMEHKVKEKKHTQLLGLLAKQPVDESKIKSAIKWINNLWNIR